MKGRLGAVATDPQPPLVSIILVTYNSTALLRPFFAALRDTEYPRYEVLVVDNGSRDGTPDLVAETCPAATVIRSPTNEGYGRACNRGAEAARGELLVFLNPDVQVTRDWLHILVRHLLEQDGCGIICPTTLYPGQRPTSRRGAVEEVAAVPGCAMMVARTPWRALGGFDNQIFMYWEDVELCWRAWLLGWRVLADLEAYVFHTRGGSGGGRSWDAEWIKNSLYAYLKLMRWRRVVPFVAFLAIKTAVKLVVLRQPGVAAGWAWNLANLRQTLALRREVARVRRADPSSLERRISVQARRMRVSRGQRPSDAP
jgi:GT2 family glycosyltransferase